MDSKYKPFILKVLKSDEIMSTNQVRQDVAKASDVRYIEFNLIYRLLEELERAGNAEKLKGPKKSYYWRKK